jgi:hypothetical protein
MKINRSTAWTSSEDAGLNLYAGLSVGAASRRNWRGSDDTGRCSCITARSEKSQLDTAKSRARYAGTHAGFLAEICAPFEPDDIKSFA